jgi:general stress protein YciG
MAKTTIIAKVSKKEIFTPSVITTPKTSAETLIEKYGKDYFSKLGAKGGQATVKKRGTDYMAKLGRKGGKTVAKEYGTKYMRTIGHKGGIAAAKKRSDNHSS